MTIGIGFPAAGSKPRPTTQFMPQQTKPKETLSTEQVGQELTPEEQFKSAQESGTIPKSAIYKGTLEGGGFQYGIPPKEQFDQSLAKGEIPQGSTYAGETAEGGFSYNLPPQMQFDEAVKVKQIPVDAIYAGESPEGGFTYTTPPISQFYDAIAAKNIPPDAIYAGESEGGGYKWKLSAQRQFEEALKNKEIPEGSIFGGETNEGGYTYNLPPETQFEQDLTSGKLVPGTTYAGVTDDGKGYKYVEPSPYKGYSDITPAMAEVDQRWIYWGRDEKGEWVLLYDPTDLTGSALKEPPTQEITLKESIVPPKLQFESWQKEHPEEKGATYAGATEEGGFSYNLTPERQFESWLKANPEMKGATFEGVSETGGFKYSIPDRIPASSTTVVLSGIKGLEATLGRRPTLKEWQNYKLQQAGFTNFDIMSYEAIPGFGPAMAGITTLIPGKQKAEVIYNIKIKAQDEYIQEYPELKWSSAFITSGEEAGFSPVRAAYPDIGIEEISGAEWGMAGVSAYLWAAPITVPATIRVISRGLSSIKSETASLREAVRATGITKVPSVSTPQLFKPTESGIITNAFGERIAVITREKPITEVTIPKMWEGLQIGGKPVIGISSGRPTLGKWGIRYPKASELAGKEGFQPITKADTSILAEANPLRKMGFANEQITQISSSRGIMGKFNAKANAPPPQVKEILPGGVKYLTDEGVSTVFKNVNKNAKDIDMVYGSRTMEPQMTDPATKWWKAAGREPADIDIQTKISEEATIKYAQRLARELELTEGKSNVRIEPESKLIETKGNDGAWHHAVDIHSRDEAYGAAEGSYGLKYSQSAVRVYYPEVGNIDIMKLSETGLRKMGSSLTWWSPQEYSAAMQKAGSISKDITQTIGSKNIIVAPAAHRAKDITDAYAITMSYFGKSEADAWAVKYGFNPDELLAGAMKSPPELIGWKYNPSSTIPSATGIPSIAIISPYGSASYNWGYEGFSPETGESESASKEISASLSKSAALESSGLLSSSPSRSKEGSAASTSKGESPSKSYEYGYEGYAEFSPSLIKSLSESGSGSISGSGSASISEPSSGSGSKSLSMSKSGSASISKSASKSGSKSPSLYPFYYIPYGSTERETIKKELDKLVKKGKYRKAKRRGGLIIYLPIMQGDPIIYLLPKKRGAVSTPMGLKQRRILEYGAIPDIAKWDLSSMEAKAPIRRLTTIKQEKLETSEEQDPWARYYLGRKLLSPDLSGVL